MAIKLSSNPTCVLSDADNLTPEQRQKINMNLTKGIPGSDIEGDKVTVINSDGEVEMKAYSAGGGGSSYTAGDGIDITSDTISVKVDNSTIGLNASGQLESLGGSGSETPCIVDWANLSVDDIISAVETALAANQPVFAKYGENYLPLTTYISDDISTQVKFIGINNMGNTYAMGYQLFATNNGASFGPEKSESNFSCSFRSLPDWSPLMDEGKILKIVDGNPTWVTP
jgi:hypothetical protein